MRLRLLALTFLIVALFLTGPVAAQAPQPPAGDDPNTSAPAPWLDQGWDEFAPRSHRPVADASPDVALGQPGTVYSYQRTFGETQAPYLADAQHLNRPNGLVVDGSNALYVVEEAGHRLVKYDSSGGAVLTLGQAGVGFSWDDFLSAPKGVAVDASGNIWVTISDAVKAFDAAGNLIQVLPENDPWNSGTDNSHFNQPRGIAFDNTGRLFVADRYNHRVQVYTVSGSSLTYQATIGVTGEPGSDNAHFNGPAEIVFDSSNRLYVADVENFRVQRCVLSATWTCSTFHGTGTSGGAANELSWAYGLGRDASGTTIYIADSNNGRVKSCTTSGTCTIPITGVNWPADVAVDAGGTVYVSDYHDFTVRKYNSNGGFLGIFAGVEDVPYVTDGMHYNAPWGVAVAPDGSIYIAESRGYRLIKLNRNGVLQWAVGQPGVHGDDNAHFGSFWSEMEGGLAVDASGRVYVPDRGNQRIQVFNADGSHYLTFGSGGSGNNEFSCPAGVAISPANGDIFVVDQCNQRVQVYTSAWVYRMTLGVVGQTGTDNRHFDWPSGVAVNASGAVFVADLNNYRVQKCTLSANDYACTTFVGETGVSGDDFDHLNPAAVAVGHDGRVVVADVWNTRIQVFDATGAYLTTIGGSYGADSGEMIAPRGVAADQYGNLYVTEHDNHRLRKYAPGVPGWRQANLNGFGDRNNWGAWSLGVFGGKLYASTNNHANGAEVYRLSSTGAWERVATGGLGDASNVGIDRLTEFGGQLYASTWVEDGSGAQIWRSPSGSAGTWSQVAQGGLGSANNTEFMTLTPFGGYLYTGTWVQDSGVHGAEIWRSTTGNNGSWTRVVSNGFDNNPNNAATLSMKVFAGSLYASTFNSSTGGEVWRTGDGVNWTQVNTDGFGSAANSHVVSLEVFGGKLYAGTRNTSTGGEIWRTSNGTSWERVLQGGFGNADNQAIAALVAFRGELIALVGNSSAGPGVWRSSTGGSGSGSKVMDDGFGAGNALRAAWDNHATVFGGALYVGTYTFGNGGGRLWKYLHNRTYLPMLTVQ
jgi:hypothetical protein